MKSLPASLLPTLLIALLSLSPSTLRADDEDLVAQKEIQAVYAQGNYAAAVTRAGEFYKQFPESPFQAQVRNLHGLSMLLTRRPLLAIPQFQRAVELSPSDSFRSFVRYNLAAAQFETSQFPEAQSTLALVQPSQLDDDNRVKFLALRAKTALRLDDPAQAVRDYLQLARSVSATESQAGFASQLDGALQRIQTTGVLEPIYREFEDSPIADRALFRAGQLSFRAGQVEPAEEQLNRLISRYPTSPHLAEAQEILRALENRSVVDSKAIGVLLPMKGKYARFGMRNLQAISQAFGIFGGPGASGAKVKYTLVVEDSGEDADSALKALGKLYFQHHVVAVIGPLLSKGVEQVTQKANELGLPMITLTQQPGIIGDWVFQAGLTPRLQAEEIARHAIEKLGLKKFAILTPKDKFGEQYSQFFWNAVEALGGEVVGYEAYMPGETDFRQAIDKLSGLYYQDARKRELDALAEERKKQNIRKRTRKTAALFDLPPIIDYQAVFVPDEPKVIGQILPTFAYRDVTKMRYLGVNTWNSQELIRRAQNWAEGAQFTDAFFPDSTSDVVKKFVEKYRSLYGETPAGMEALAFDAATILEFALSTGATTRRDVADYVKNLTTFAGVTGRITQKEGYLTRTLTILTIKGGTIAEVR